MKKLKKKIVIICESSNDLEFLQKVLMQPEGCPYFFPDPRNQTGVCVLNIHDYSERAPIKKYY